MTATTNIIDAHINNDKKPFDSKVIKYLENQKKILVLSTLTRKVEELQKQIVEIQNTQSLTLTLQFLSGIDSKGFY